MTAPLTSQLLEKRMQGRIGPHNDPRFSSAHRAQDTNQQWQELKTLPKTASTHLRCGMLRSGPPNWRVADMLPSPLIDTLASTGFPLYVNHQGAWITNTVASGSVSVSKSITKEQRSWCAHVSDQDSQSPFRFSQLHQGPKYHEVYAKGLQVKIVNLSPFPSGNRWSYTIFKVIQLSKHMKG